MRVRGSTRRLVPAAVAAVALGGLVPTAIARAQDAESATQGDTLSVRNANYAIDVRLDAETRRLTGRQTLTWTNTQEQPTRRLWFHLYWNAWRNRHSTWMREDRIRGRSSLGDRVQAEDWSYLEVDAVRLAETGQDLTRTMYFAFPDDRNVEDRTVMVVLLPELVAQGETVRLEMDWRAKVPRTFARTGFRGEYYFIAHWFPKLGVYESDGWNCHQFHAATEFYSDYGVYDVSITVPEGWVVGATGREVEVGANGDGTATHRYVEEDVHAFTWTTSPDYLELWDRFEHPDLPPVDLRLLLQPEHAAQAERHFAATKTALASYGTWYGAYPYGHLTVVDPAYGSGAGGMEYPTLFTSGTRLFNPPGGGRPEGVTIHEAGHQFWYGIVGNNEFEYAWLDEGLNTFSTGRSQHEAYGESLYVHRFFEPPGIRGSGFFALTLDGFDYGGRPHVNRIERYRTTASDDFQSTPTWRYYPASAGNISYSKTALWLSTLENWLGWESLQRILSTFFQRWGFRHPTDQDFLEVAEEMTEQDVGGFLKRVMGSGQFDYAIQEVATFSAANEGWVGEGEERTLVEGREDDDEEAAVFRSEVVARRLGEGVFPVEVALVFEDGHEIRKKWAGQARWKLFVEEYSSRLEYAVVDPDRILALDVDPKNNSLQVTSEAALPAAKWAARWTVWFEDFLASFAAFV